MNKVTLKYDDRKDFGNKVKKIRKAGLIPASIYGKKFKSQAISVKEAEFMKVFEKAGETGLINLETDKTNYPVLISSVQIHPVTDKILHIEFHKVDLKEKVKASVPIEITGVAKAVSEKKGILLTLLNEIEVEALPADLPDHIKVDVTSLSEVNQDIKIADIKLATDISVSLSGDTSVVKIAPLVIKEEETVEQKAEETEEKKEGEQTESKAEEKDSAAKEGETENEKEEKGSKE